MVRKSPSAKQTGRKPGKLTAKQRRFAKEYLTDLNASAAAIRAGYPPAGAGVAGYRLLKNAQIAALIEAGSQKISERTEITQENIMREFARIGFADMRRLFGAGGSLRPIHDLSADEAACLSSVEVVTKRLPSVEGQPVEVEHVHKLRAWDKVAALTQMGRRLGMFVEQHQQLGPDGKPVAPGTTFVLKVER